VLNYKGMHREAAEHFEYISSRAKNRSNTPASEHCILGEGFESSGSLARALEEYRQAFELEPSNETMCYRLGCCLFENGHHEEAVQQFTLFLDLIQDKDQLTEDEKELYRTESLILIALCNHGRTD
jgi:tetratricopeptide (TPR) repeat protein